MTLRLTAARWRGIAAIAAIACAALLSACAPMASAPPVPPAAAAPFGAATRAVLARQIAHPDAASQARDPAVAGMDGRAAGQAQGRYQKSFTEPPAQQSSFTIGVSGGK